MFATAGLTWFAVTQSTPAMTPDVRAGAVAAEHADGVERHLLRDAVGRAAGRAGDVRAVAVAVVRALAVVDAV